MIKIGVIGMVLFAFLTVAILLVSVKTSFWPGEMMGGFLLVLLGYNIYDAYKFVKNNLTLV